MEGEEEERWGWRERRRRRRDGGESGGTGLGQVGMREREKRAVNSSLGREHESIVSGAYKFCQG